jgi:hypothetical protein
MKHIENLTELTWKQRREFLEGWILFSQPPEQGQAILPQRYEGQGQAGPSHHGDAQRESTTKQERTWTTQQLHRLVEEMIHIEDFNVKTFQDSLSEESKAICEQLDKYGRSLNDQELEDIRTKFKNHNLSFTNKRYRYLFIRTNKERDRRKQYDDNLNSIAQSKGLKNRYELHKK